MSSILDPLVFIDSWDHYASADITAKWVSAGGNVTTGRTGNGYAFAIGGAPFVTFPDEFDTLCVGVAYKTQALANAIIQLSNARFSGNLIGYLEHVGDGRIQVRLQGATANIVPGFVMTTNQFYHFGFRAALSSGGGSTVVMSYQVWVNGKLLVTDSVSASIAGNAPLNWATLLLGAPGGGNTATVDDLWVTDDEFLGDLRIYVRRVNADGDEADWGASTSGADHYTMKDDVTPDADATYIFSDTVGDKELEQLEDVGVSGTIKAAQFLWMAEKDEAGEASYRGLLKSSGVEEVLAEHAPSYASWLYHRVPLLKSPFTGNDWGNSEFNALQMGEERMT